MAPGERPATILYARPIALVARIGAITKESVLNRISLATVAAFLTMSLTAAAQSPVWQLDPAHSTAQFAVRHLGISTVRGNFTKVSGTVRYDPADPKNASVDVS